MTGEVADQQAFEVELPRAYSFAEAASRLTAAGYDVTDVWLRNNTSRVPHVHMAGKTRYTDALLLEFIENQTRRPQVDLEHPNPMRLFSLDEAAELLDPLCTVNWLRHHLDQIPHVRSQSGRGRAGRVAFTEEHLAQILKSLERIPAEQLNRDPNELRPSSRRRPTDFQGSIERDRRRNSRK